MSRVAPISRPRHRQGPNQVIVAPSTDADASLLAAASRCKARDDRPKVHSARVPDREGGGQRRSTWAPATWEQPQWRGEAHLTIDGWTEEEAA